MIKIIIPVFILAMSLMIPTALATHTVENITLNINPDFTQAETRTTNVPVGWYYGELENAFGSAPPFFTDNPTPWNTSRADYTGNEVILIFDTTQFGFDKLPLVIQEPISIFDFNSTGNFDDVFYTANYRFDEIGGTDATFQGCAVFTDSFDVFIAFKCWGYNNVSSSIPSDPIFANQIITDLGGGLFSFSADVDFSTVNQADLDRTALIDIQLGRGGNHLGNITVFDSTFFKTVPIQDPPPDITGTPALLVSIIGIVIALSGIVIAGIFLVSRERVRIEDLLIAFVIGLMAVVFASAVGGFII